MNYQGHSVERSGGDWMITAGRYSELAFMPFPSKPLAHSFIRACMEHDTAPHLAKPRVNLTPRQIAELIGAELYAA